VAEPREMKFRNPRRDEIARFLRELRELRDHAGLDQAELAARAHYPCDVIRAAEAGPSLPDLPVLSAYVRGCGGMLPEWEERWRTVTGSPASPLLPTRAAGCSEAANAGARVGAASVIPDGHDPDRVMAALNRVADGMAAASSSSSTPGAGGPMLDSPALADAAVPDSALYDTGLSDAAVFDTAAFEALAGTPAAPGAPGAPGPTGVPAAPNPVTPTGASVWDVTLPTQRANYPTPTASAPRPAAQRPAAQRGWAPAAASQASDADGPRGSGMARGVLIAVVLVLVVAVLVLFA
jgi:hypothetical protein